MTARLSLGALALLRELVANADPDQPTHGRLQPAFKCRELYALMNAGLVQINRANTEYWLPTDEDGVVCGGSV